MPVAGLVLHPDIMGVRPLFDDLCRRLATHGFAVCAPEPFARPVEVRAEADPSARMALVAELDDDLQIGDLEAAADYLVVHDDVREVAVLGFCMGGMYALKAAATGRFDRAVAFYGMIRLPEGWVGPRRVAPLDTAADVCPTLAIFGGQDPYTPAADIDALRAAWADRPDCEIVVYPTPSTGSCTTPSARRTAPTTPPTPGAACSRSCRPTEPSARSERGALVQRLAVEDPVAVAAVDLDPAEPHEQRQRLVHPLAAGADETGELLLGHRQPELVGVAGELEQPLGGAGGDVEEHRVGERLVGGAQAAGEEAHDDPEQGRVLVDRAAHGVVPEHQDVGLFERARLGGAGSVVEQAHLAEERPSPGRPPSTRARRGSG